VKVCIFVAVGPWMENTVEDILRQMNPYLRRIKQKDWLKAMNSKNGKVVRFLSFLSVPYFPD
jgi:hypothetical protein